MTQNELPRLLGRTRWERAISLFLPTLSAILLILGARNALYAAAPAAPVINEPGVDGQIVSPSDVHMETDPMSDPDGDFHTCSDWQIIISDTLEVIWESVCIGGVEKVHTHLGDGTFQGSYAGFVELEHDTDYIMQVRHIDDQAEQSPWSQRFFRTGPATQQFPYELDNILSFPVPAWVDSSTSPIILPAGAPQPFVRFDSAGGDLFLEYQGLDGVSNATTNPLALATHEYMRIQVFAGDSGGNLVLPESDLTIVDGTGSQKTIYLPSINLGANQTLYFWVAADGSTYVGDGAQTEPVFGDLARGAPVPWLTLQTGYKVEVVATGFQLPVHIAFVPDGVYPGDPGDPKFYVTELYGKIKVVTNDGNVYDYATDLLNFNPTGNFPGSGEQGVAGVAVDPATGDVFASMLYSSNPADDAAPHYPKVVHFQSNNGGITATMQTTILDMVGESQGQSHQISSVTIGPDDKLYVHMGDGFDASTALNLDSFRGKILRMNLDGSAPADNPLYVGGGGARDYIYAWGLRNPFGGAWRQSDGELYEVENGPSIDRFARVISNTNYGWDGSNGSMNNLSIYNWNPAHAPVGIAFTQNGTFSGSGFPAEKMDHAFVTESGPTWASGPQTRGKRIVEFVLDGTGNLVSGPTKLIEYNGTGKASAAGIAAGPDGLYFADLYKDTDYVSPIDPGANILRVRFVGDADFTASPRIGPAPLTVVFTDTSNVPSPTAWEWDFGDGNTSSLQNPTHTYTQTGVYDVSLRVFSADGVTVESKSGFIVADDVGNGAGLLGQYYTFSGSTPPADPFQTFVKEQIDATVDFDWGGGAPSGLPNNLFSVRWIGSVEPLFSEEYTFFTNSDDGIRLYVDGQLIVDDWSDHAVRERSGTITLQAGQKVDIEVHFYENGGDAVAEVSWQSASQTKEIIPALFLYPPADLEISKAATPEPVAIGEYITYTLTLTNSGWYTATDVMVTDTLPSGVTFVNGSTCTLDGDQVLCQAGDLNVGSSTAVSFTAHIPITATGTITNEAVVDSVSFELNASDNDASVTSTVTTAAPPHIYVGTTVAVCAGQAPCSKNLVQALATVADNGRITLLDNYTIDGGLTSGNGGTNNLLVDGPGMFAWDGSFNEAMFVVSTGNVTFEEVSMEAIAPGTAVSVTGSGHLTMTGSSQTVVGFDTAVAMHGSGTALVKGVGFDGNDVPFAQSSGTLNAYANNLTNWTTAYTGTGSAQLGQNYWGTKVVSDTDPGLPAGDWDRRLGAAVSSWSDGTDSAALGQASLSGGSGTAVIISHGRGMANAPFGVGVAPFVDAMCSDFYDYFVRDGSGTWALTVPVDNNVGCQNQVRDPKRVYRITDYLECTAADASGCWDALDPADISVVGDNLVVANQSTASLNGTAITAGSGLGGEDPTVVVLDSLGQASNGAPLTSLLLTGLVVMTLIFLLARKRRLS